MPGYDLFDQQEIDALGRLFREGGKLNRYAASLSGGGSDVDRFEREIRGVYPFRHALAVNSGTTALHCFFKAFGVRPGDEVLIPSFGYAAAALAVLECGATPRFFTVQDPFTADLDSLEKSVTAKTRLAVLIHMLGVFHAPAAVLTFLNQRGIPILHDMAQCFGADVPANLLDSSDHSFTFSFDFNKTITTGEGGLLGVRDDRLFDLCHAYSDMGHAHRPGSPKYCDPGQSTGLNYRMSELSGCIGLVQLRKFLAVRRNRIRRMAELEEISREAGFTVVRPADASSNGDSLTIDAGSKEQAEELMAKFRAAGLEVRTLPNALLWNWCALWTHLPCSITSSSYGQADIDRERAMLERCVSIAIHFGQEDSCMEAVRGQHSAVS